MAVVASRLVQGAISRRPGTGGIAAPEPTAMITARRAVSASVAPSDCSTATVRAPVEPGLAAVERDAAILEPGQLGGVVEIVDHLVAALEDLLGVELAGRHPGDPAVLGEQLARAQQRLGGHARPVGALAADQLALDDRDVEALSGQQPGGDLAGRTGAEHDHVVLAHAARP